MAKASPASCEISKELVRRTDLNHPLGRMAEQTRPDQGAVAYMR